MIEFTARPIDRWPQEPTPPDRRKNAQFKADYNNTKRMLSYELERIGVKKVYLQLDVVESDIRNDGSLRGDRQPRGPRVIVSAVSKHGPISLPCDTYRDWKDNVRAIALSLEALRAVDRHGVTKRGEQYRGLKQLAASSGPINSAEAAAFIAKHCAGANAADILRDAEEFRLRYREASKSLHVDKGGDALAWGYLQSADVILREHHGR